LRISAEDIYFSKTKAERGLHCGQSRGYYMRWLGERVGALP